MTYLEKLLELNIRTRKNANLLFAAIKRLDNEEIKPVSKKSCISVLKNEVNQLISDYQDALFASENMISFVNSNHVNLKTVYTHI